MFIATAAAWISAGSFDVQNSFPLYIFALIVYNVCMLYFSSGSDYDFHIWIGLMEIDFLQAKFILFNALDLQLYGEGNKDTEMGGV